MRIILDAMGGDNAPGEIIKGAAEALDTLGDGLTVIAVGDEAKVREAAKAAGLAEQAGRFEVVHASEVIEMCDQPVRAISRKKDSSLVVGLKMLAAGQGDAFVSAGSTGALYAGAKKFVGCLAKIRRPALATVIPGSKKPYMLLDSGANPECRPPMLETFGVMGSVYMQKVQGIESPSVALVNNGAEESKGTPLYQEAHQLLKKNPHIRFVGNIEPRDIPAGNADVVVCDGFTGNVILKLTEGLAKSLLGMIKQIFLANGLSKLAYLLVKGGMSGLKKQMDSEEYGGAPLLGCAKPVIKAHGSSKAKAIKNAIRQAKICVESGMVDTMAAALSELAETDGKENG